VAIKDDATAIQTGGWRTLAALYGLVNGELEQDLQSAAGLTVVEYSVLDALSRQDGWRMRMRPLAQATALSASATTRLVNRMERRGLLQRILCANDRRGIYTELTLRGGELLASARPAHDRALEKAWAGAEATVELAPLVRVLLQNSVLV
jgi:DNA-binding MarR family transcriptional regulator